MRIAISGSSGLVGTALMKRLRAEGHEVVSMVRTQPEEGSDDIFYDAPSGQIERDKLATVDAVVNLAGDSVGEGRWSESKKRRIRDSRVETTKLIAQAIADLSRPKHLICASAIGIYGDRADELLDEGSEVGEGFLAGVCEAWESACDPARAAAKRVVSARIGVVLTTAGGALPRMLTPFKLGVGGVIGSGKQWMSWITLQDVVSALAFLTTQSGMSGPVNLSSPEPVTNRELTDSLGRHLRRPTLMPLPAFAARLMLGERADALLLASACVRPRRLMASAFNFAHPHIDNALSAVLQGDDDTSAPIALEQAG